MISYCVALFRPTYSRYLIDELIRKTTAPYEILVWLNITDVGFEEFLTERIDSGSPIRIIGRSPENIGMAAYPSLFAASRFDMVAQVDDDVIYISPRIAETAREIFIRFPKIGMLAADVWQDQYTNGARPPLESYREVSRQFGLLDGPIDGWFAIYRRASLHLCRGLKPERYCYLGGAIKRQLQAFGQSGLLCRRMKVFHVTGAPYAHFFGVLDSEIEKYAALGLIDLADSYRRCDIPTMKQLSQQIDCARASLESVPEIQT